MDELQVFTYEKKEVRTIQKNGETWWVLKDVCGALGLSNPTVVADRLDDDERAKFDLGRQGETNIVNESGLYNVILRSDKPEAKQFKRWVTHEVLPQIRKHGMYATDAAKLEAQQKRASAMLLNAQSRALQTLMRTINDKKLSPIAAEVYGLKCVEQITGVDMGQYLPEHEKTYSATEIANMLGCTPNRIGKIANQYGIKTPEYGAYVLDKARGHNKEVSNFRYNQKGFEFLSAHCT